MNFRGLVEADENLLSRIIGFLDVIHGVLAVKKMTDMFSNPRIKRVNVGLHLQVGEIVPADLLFGLIVRPLPLSLGHLLPDTGCGKRGLGDVVH